MSFPRRYARTQRFTLGRPRAFTVAPDGGRVLFLRACGPEDPLTELWCYDVADGRERRLVAVADHLAAGDESLPPEERARRERAREGSSGITTYACDRGVSVAAFTLAGRLYTVDVATGEVREHASAGPVFDPRPDPAGAAVAYASGGAVWVRDLGRAGRRAAAEHAGQGAGEDAAGVVGGEGDAATDVPPASRRVAGEGGDGVDGITWGVAEFVAAEEMGRGRGFWWSPDGASLAVTRVDERPVDCWWVADPARPDVAPAAHRYPAAGTANAAVSLHLVPATGEGGPVEVAWDATAFPYLARVGWHAHAPAGGPTLLVQTRDQRRWQILHAGLDGATHVVREDHDDAWLELVAGTPAWLADGRLVVVVPTDRGAGGTTSLVVGDEVVTPTGLQVRAVVHVGQDAVTFLAAEADPTQLQAWQWDAHAGVRRLTPELQGISAAAVGGPTTVLVRETLDGPVTIAVRSVTGERSLGNRAATPSVQPAVQLLALGPRRLPAALLLPADAQPDAQLPVLLDPYGGPHGERVVQARDRFLVSQWFADQGFAVLVVDGRGMPNRGPAWERAVAFDLATPVLDDQIDALRAAAVHEPRLDLDRVGIRGWSFGGYLAALAVLRRPDVFRAAVAGAPVTDWRLYDTHYTERYLGTPQEHPEAYRISSLVDTDGELVEAAPLGSRDAPALLLIHGLADDNVVVAHTLRLSQALLAAGHPHQFLPLSGVTHMTPQEVVAERLLLVQRDLFREALA